MATAAVRPNIPVTRRPNAYNSGRY
jgi:hypothetical protein